jgi:hypothetical protein
MKSAERGNTGRNADRMARLTSLQGSESWARRQNEETRNRAAEMRFHKAIKNSTRKDRIRNERTSDDLLQIHSIKKKIRRDYKNGEKNLQK